MGTADPTSKIFLPSIAKRAANFVHRQLEIIRKVPYLTTLAAVIGLGIFVTLTWINGHAYLADRDENIVLHYRLALSDEAQSEFLYEFFMTHAQLGVLLLLPAFFLSMVRERGRHFVLPLTLATLVVFFVWIVSDIHSNWSTAHSTSMGEAPAPKAYYAKLLVIGSFIWTIPFMYWLYYRSTILDRYVVRSFLAPFLMCLLGIVAIVITWDLVGNANDFLKANFTPAMVGKFYLRQIPQILVMIMDASLLLATLYVLSRMSRFNEIVSMLGAGISLVRILVPLLIMGVWSTHLVLAMNIEWAPSAQGVKDAMLRMADKAAAERSRTRARREQASTYNVMFRNREENRTWFVGRVANKIIGNSVPIEFLFVAQDDGNGEFLKAWYAKRALWFPEQRQWRLYNASIIDPALLKGLDPTIPTFEKLEVEEKWLETPWNILSAKMNPEYLPAQDLSAYLNSYVTLENKKLARYETTFHSRFSLPFRSLLMVLIAAPLGIVTSRRGVLAGVGYSVIIFVIIYFLYLICLKLGDGGFVAPQVGAWIVIWIFGLFGLLQLWMKNYNIQYPSLNPLKWFKRVPA